MCEAFPFSMKIACALLGNYRSRLTATEGGGPLIGAKEEGMDGCLCEGRGAKMGPGLSTHMNSMEEESGAL